MARSEAHETDWVGSWFALLKERGGNDLFTIVRYNVRTGETEYFDHSHIEVDGIGGMMNTVEQRGYVVDPPTTVGSEPGWGELLRSAGAFRRAMRASALPWRLSGSERHPTPHDFDFIVLNEAQTRDLKAWLRTQRYSLAAYLLSRVHGVLAPHYLREDVPARWLFPLNLRGPVRRADPKSNHSSAIPLVCRFHTTPDELRVQMHQCLRDNLHWWSWRVMHVGRIIGLRGMRWLSRREQHRRVWMGSFTFIGEWPRRGGAPLSTPDEILVGVPPGSPGYPIGVGASVWHGRLCLALKLHPMIEHDQSAVSARLAEIRAALLADVAQGEGQ
ncbi:MAG: hypothetical protein ABR578_01165 [Chromatocurvus sp.]